MRTLISGCRYTDTSHQFILHSLFRHRLTSVKAAWLLQVQLVPPDRADDLTIWSDSSTQQWVSAHTDVGAPPPADTEPAHQV